jgi:cysteine-rich repeat protein
MVLKPTQRRLALFLIAACNCFAGCLELPEPLETIFPDQSIAIVIPDVQRLGDVVMISDATNRGVDDEGVVSDGGLMGGDALLDIGTADVQSLDSTAMDATPALCGDGNLDPSEECDHGGASAQCSEQCLLIVCGNGRVDSGEACDDANLDETDQCIDACSVFFPDTWDILLSSDSLELPNVPMLFCRGDQANPFDDLSMHYEVQQGRRAYASWFSDAELWIPFGVSLVRPTKVSLDLHVPDGFGRDVKIGLSTRLPECGASFRGVFLKHDDRKDAGNSPLVRVTAGISPDGSVFEHDRSGVHDAWFRVSIVFLPDSGYARVWYDGRFVGQLQLPPGETVDAIRLKSGYDRGEDVGAPILMAGFELEQYIP